MVLSYQSQRGGIPQMPFLILEPFYIAVYLMGNCNWFGSDSILGEVLVDDYEVGMARCCCCVAIAG